MNKPLLSLVLPVLLASVTASAQPGPFPPDSWPSTIDPTKTVHFVVTDGGLTAPSDSWTPDLSILSGGDQGTADITIGGFTGKKATDAYVNVADALFEEWADDPVIDILVQAFGDAALFNAEGQPRNFTFLIGTLPEIAGVVGGQVPIEARNRKWNWLLFRIENTARADGTLRVGSIPENAQGASGFGGVNGGTIRFEGVGDLTVRTIAFGVQGAFGEPEDFTQFAPPDACAPEPETNLAGIDVSANTADHMQVLNDGDQTVTFADNVGPAGDTRRVVRPDGLFLNFGVTDNYLGLPCNDPHAVKVCVEFYDDPGFAGQEVRFGPEAYATDGEGGIGFVAAEQRHLMEGSGRWIRRSWVIPAVNLRGVNAGTLTAGPRFMSENGSVAVSNLKLAVLRSGSHPLSGQDPLADCYQDQLICTDAYGSSAELDLAADVRDGLDVGSSGGDQEMIVAEAGPANDRRMAVRAAHDDGTSGFNHQYLNFAITEEALGPNSQDPAHLAICATYYDDPELVGATIRPEVYQTERFGNLAFAFTGGDAAVALEGTGTWREAYWELEGVKFNGVNQGPQAAARFTTSAKIFVSRLQYAVIRPCGPNAGANLLEDCKPEPSDASLTFARNADGSIRLSWPASATGMTLQSTAALGTAWTAEAGTPTAEGDQLVQTVSPTGTRFYRLVGP